MEGVAVDTAATAAHQALDGLVARDPIIGAITVVVMIVGLQWLKNMSGGASKSVKSDTAVVDLLPRGWQEQAIKSNEKVTVSLGEITQYLKEHNNLMERGVEAIERSERLLLQYVRPK